MTILEALQVKQLLVDGAMGTQLQARGLPIGEHPEYFNLSHPEIVKAIHQDYILAGADIITTNTFQANRTKLKADEIKPIIEKAIQIAKSTNPKYVAYDMGPIGQLLQPMGTLSFESAYDYFKEQAIIAEQAGADLIIFETMSDLLEAKIGVLAVKENTNLPLFVTMTYQADGRTFVGTNPKTATLTLQNLGVDVIGVNCSLGPKELAPVVSEILTYAQVPVMVQANAGLPEMVDGESVYRITADEYVNYSKTLLKQGVRVIGGCCGTTPAFIRKLRRAVDQQPLIRTKPHSLTAVTSGIETVELGQGLSLIGERINPTGKAQLKQALRNNDLAYLLKEAVLQAEAGADILDVNVGLPEIDEPKMMVEAIKQIQSLINCPLQIDSSQVKALESGARYYNGIPLINSVNGKQKSLDQVLPIVAKYGAVVLGLCIDETGIPETAEQRFEIAQKIVLEAKKYGISSERVMIDPLVLTASAQQAQVEVTLETIRLVKARLGCKTAVGLSNISFGLPNRDLLNGTFLAAAVGAGLDAPIMNPLSDYMMRIVKALKVISMQDINATAYIESEQDSQITTTQSTKLAQQKEVEAILDLKEMIVKGRKELTAKETASLLERLTPLEVVDSYFIPALNIVGQKFEAGELFLPQLMQSAEATKNAQVVLKAKMDQQGQIAVSKGKILLCTVEGDIHDIGKNIVKMILENYGFEVIDLGKDVPVETVVKTVINEDIQLIGLSALMTTTVQNMKQTIAAVRASGHKAQFMVGGAVLNEEYREFVDAEYYAKDAMASVAIANQFFANQKAQD
ncbi:MULTISPECIES: homocysteine S-methyltransferase family protein [unclassified Enterococcus]|uniref:homocysteine S-methyltransferase family protein n=1 Tax=unclassified Enterococcus TaxID=2608891 RepID=UPI001555B1F7|nr:MULTISPECIES: homocysteine S-methyltransferase family protein [unclassified Enterococcus]MBS7578005.1 homocysteine S-methyltransferase family protein [Enterococcus sp. MMGLQ5-2]MBS7585305.1 homocysteine S-methyltransferase family protein [Enterococcus sp. MMGLQ5-1]NPD13162.1 dihydropteroate synthase [Enterococcus sp. MMGLQ5-1]NPD37836.1 dihydropteroate synthase [Enterococcus sp. MMGLQ5-2]